MGGEELATEGESIDLRDFDEKVPCVQQTNFTMIDRYKQRL